VVEVGQSVSAVAGNEGRCWRNQPRAWWLEGEEEGKDGVGEGQAAGAEVAGRQGSTTLLILMLVARD